ncbi:NADPH:quinone reductase [Frondihabitans sp. PAMC 28766]|nr:NADPH:quinone reductase [Frondihabitans sp. PAMC 28766]
MRAITIEKFGPAEGLALSERPEPAVVAGSVLIEVEAIGVGGVDAVIRRGTLGSSFPVGMVPGSEVAGRVTQAGEGVAGSWVGKRVWAFTGTSGAYAERAVAHLDDVTELPDALRSSDAVALGGAGPVAHFALEHARFEAGQSVLVRGAAGSLGIMALQLAAAAGASAIGVTTSSPERGRRLRDLGATRILDRTAQPAEGDDAPGAFDVVIDIVGGPELPSFVELLAPNGRFVSIGVVGGYPPADFGMTLMRLFQRSLSFATFSLDTVPMAERNAARADIFARAARGELRAVVDGILPLADAAEAHRRMDAGTVFGRIVLTP